MYGLVFGIFHSRVDLVGYLISHQGKNVLTALRKGLVLAPLTWQYVHQILTPSRLTSGYLAALFCLIVERQGNYWSDLCAVKLQIRFGFIHKDFRFKMVFLERFNKVPSVCL